MHCGFGCRLYLAGLPRGTVYESQPCQKGWPSVSSVGHEELLQHLSCLHEFRVCEQLGAKDDVPEPTMLAHWCTLRGLSVGKLDLVNVPHPTHLRLRKRTWRSTGGVYLRSTTITRDHICASDSRQGGRLASGRCPTLTFMQALRTAGSIPWGNGVTCVTRGGHEQRTCP